MTNYSYLNRFSKSRSWFVLFPLPLPSWVNTYSSLAKSLQSCPTLCDPIDGSPPGSPIPEILQARTLEWVAISFSNEWKWKVKIFQARVLEWGATASSYSSFKFLQKSLAPLPIFSWPLSSSIFFYYWSIIVLQNVFVSAVQWNKSAMCIHIPPPTPEPPSRSPSHPSRSSQSRAELPVLYSLFPLAVYFTPGHVYLLILLSQFVPPLPSHLVSTCPFLL